MKIRVRTYKGLANLQLGMWWHRRRGFTIVGNVIPSRRLFRSILYTVTFQKGEH